MKGKSRLLPTLIIFIAGLVLVIYHSDPTILRSIITFLGISFMLPSVIYFAIVYFSRPEVENLETGEMEKKIPRSAMPGVIASFFGFLLGFVMVIIPTTFVAIVAYLFASLLIIGGIYHILAITVWAKPFRLPLYFYIVPALLILAGFIILFTGVRTLGNTVVLITGIGMIISTLSTLMEHIATHPAAEHTKALDNKKIAKDEIKSIESKDADKSKEISDTPKRTPHTFE